MSWSFPWSRRVVTNHLGFGLIVCWGIREGKVERAWVVRAKKPRRR